MEATMKKIYIRPAINVISQSYSEGLMQIESIPYVPGGTMGGGDAKPGGEWGDGWTEPTTDVTTEDAYWGM